MKKNVASQVIGAEMITAADGSAFTGAVTVYVTGDGGTQAVGSVGSGACTHEGNGFHTYVPAQAETNYDHIAFTFIGTGAIPATVQTYTTFPQTVDNATNITAIKTKTDFLPSVTAGASGGVFIAGTNAATTVTTSFTTTFTGNLTGSVGSVTTVSDKTGYALSAAGIDAIYDESLAAHQTALTAGRAITLGGVPIAETTATGTPTTTSIQLTGGSSVDNFYNNQTFKILSGSGAGQARIITTYTGATKTCGFDEAFTTAPSAGDVVAIAVDHVHPITEISTQVMADLDASGSTVIDAISSNAIATLADTNELQTAHSAGTLGSNVKKINSVTIVGDGSATPFNV